MSRFGDPKEGEDLCQILQVWALVAWGVVFGAYRQPEGYTGRSIQDWFDDAVGGAEDTI